MKKLNLLLAIGILISTFSCRKEYDSPPVQNLPLGNILTIEELKAFRDSVGAAYTLTEDYSVYATATTDESSGNFYKEVYVQAGNHAIQLRLANAGGLYEGDSIRIYLKGTTIDIYRGMFQLDGVDVDNNIIKQATGKHVTPALRTITTINPDADRGLLVTFEDVEFEQASMGATWSNSSTQSDVNHNILNCNLNSLIVRTSGYANFADEIIPSLNGSLTGIVGIYTTETNPALFTTLDLQIYVRDTESADFTNTRCTSSGIPPILEKNFNDGSITSGGWTTQLVMGTLNWTVGEFGGQSYGNMSNYNGSTNEINESWLISPSIDLSGTTAPALSFNNAYSYTGNALEVLVSVDYSGNGDPNLATWTSFTGGALWSSGFFEWVNSGPLNLSSFTQNGVYVAFKYIGSASDGSTWEVDDIKIEEL